MQERKPNVEFYESESRYGTNINTNQVHIVHEEEDKVDQRDEPRQITSDMLGIDHFYNNTNQK